MCMIVLNENTTIKLYFLIKIKILLIYYEEEFQESYKIITKFIILYKVQFNFIMC